MFYRSILGAVILTVAIGSGCSNPAPATASASPVASPSASTPSAGPGAEEARKKLAESGIEATPARLNEAARGAGYDTAVWLLEVGVDPNARDKDSTPLWWAATTSQLKMATLLLDRGADPNLPGFNGRTPLMEAASKKNVALVKLLLERGGDPALADQDGITAVHLAALEGELESLKLLVEKGGDVRARTSGAGYEPIHSATVKGNLEKVKFLLAHGADINARNKSGETCLAMALDDEHDELAAFLKKNGGVR